MRILSSKPRPVLPGRATKGPQCWCYESVWRVSETVLRVSLKRESYLMHSQLRVDAWDPLQREWHPLLTRSADGYRAAGVDPYARIAPLDAFHADEARLLADAAAVLAAATRPGRRHPRGARA